MADKNQYIVNTADLVSVADSIRTKAGTSENLVFPGEFISTINDIPSGQTIPDIEYMSHLFEDREELIPVLLPHCNNIRNGDYAFAYCTNIANTSIDLSHINLGACDNFEYMFYSCTYLMNVKLFNGGTSNKVNNIDHMFDNCTRIEEINMSTFYVAFLDYYRACYNVFNGCTSLKRVVLPKIDSSYNLGNGVFNNCSSLQEIIIPCDNMYGIVENKNPFSGSTVESLNCNIYVNDYAYDFYMADSQWNTYKTIIKKISEYPGVHWWES